MEDWLALTIIVLCLMLSFFFSGSETALTATSRARMLHMAKTGDVRASLVARLIKTRERMIGAILTGNNIVNITASALTTGLLLSWFGDVGVLYATAIMTVVIVVFTEVLPKSIAINSADRFALAVAWPIAWLVRLMGPVLIALETIVRFFMRLLGVKLGTDQAFLSAHEELRGQVDFLHFEGGMEKLDHDMMGGLLDLRDLAVADVMIHRTEMVTISADDAPADIVRAALSAQFTRIPLWRETPENIVGILHAKDLLRAIQAAEGDLGKVDVMSIALQPWFVPEIRPLSEQLKAFRRRKTHFALVVDEYGEVQGLVTLEDILEEIVGDISDEHDIPVPGVRPLPDGSVNVDGAVPIRDLNRAMDWRLPDAEATTIAGLVIHEARSIPDAGQSFTFYGFRFSVLRKERNRITSLRITPLGRRATPMVRVV
jgi:Mg2+/Co2+ transporter CorB